MDRIRFLFYPGVRNGPAPGFMQQDGVQYPPRRPPAGKTIRDAARGARAQNIAGFRGNLRFPHEE